MTKGMYGVFGGQYVPETLMIVLGELGNAYEQIEDNADFQRELQFYLRKYTNRPFLLYYTRKTSEELGDAGIYLKREDLNRTGVHRISNVLGQTLLAKQMRKTKTIVETGTEQHGIASATAAALFDMECEVFTGVEDIRRQPLDVFKMKLLRATVIEVPSGTGTLKDACNEAMRAWASRCDDTFYVLGSAVGPHLYPMIVRNSQGIISEEMEIRCLEKEGRLPDAVIACVGGGSNIIGTFYDLLKDEDVTLIEYETMGKGIHTEQYATTTARGSTGVLYGMKLLFLQDDGGQITLVYSISTGLDYPGIGPEYADLAQSGRVRYVPVTDDEVVAAFLYLTKTEGIIPAVGNSHALAYAMKLTPTMSRDSVPTVTLSGRGDRDIKSITEYLEVDVHG